MKANQVYPLSILLLISACMTSPKGSKELMLRMQADQTKQRPGLSDPQRGRPLFAEVACYPQLLPQGDIFTGGVILLHTGREALALGDYVAKYQAEGAKP